MIIRESVREKLSTPAFISSPLFDEMRVHFDKLQEVCFVVHEIQAIGIGYLLDDT